MAWLLALTTAVVLAWVARILWWNWPRRPPSAKRVLGQEELERKISALDCKPMREAIAAQAPEFASWCLEQYEAADDAARADMRAFFEEDGPRRIHEFRLKAINGTPTSSDLQGWHDA